MKLVLEIDTENVGQIQEASKVISVLLAVNGLTTEVKTENPHSVTEKGSEEPKKEKTTQSTPEKKKAVQPKSEPKPEAEKPAPKKTTGKVTLDVLKEVAKNAVGRTDRVKVKEVISEYADKLADVKPEDYEALHDKLEKLG